MVITKGSDPFNPGSNPGRPLILYIYTTTRNRTPVLRLGTTNDNHYTIVALIYIYIYI